MTALGPLLGEQPQRRMGLDAHGPAVGAHETVEALHLRAGAAADVDRRVSRLRGQRGEGPLTQSSDGGLLLLQVEHAHHGGEPRVATLTDLALLEHAS